MAAGKTTIGRLLAKQLNRQFYDSDQEIEKKTGASISLIFELEGETGFRKRETAMLKQLCQLENAVIATGGGMVLSSENRVYLKANGYIVYLMVQLKDVFIRTQHDSSRPLLNSDQQELLVRYENRQPLYAGIADCVIDTGKQSANSVARELMKRLPPSYS